MIKRDNNYFTSIDMSIIDINDNSPRFENKIYTISISENINVGHESLLPVATDPDFGVNSTQGYRIESGNDGNVFQIVKKNYGSLTFFLRVSKHLDRESQVEYNLQIAAYDGGDPQKTDTLQIKVIVEDENDCTPEFDRTNYVFYVDENVERGSTIAQVP